MTVIEQKKKLDEQMLGHIGSMQTCILTENYELLDDFHVLLGDRIRQQRLLMSEKPLALPKISSLEMPRKTTLHPPLPMVDGDSMIETFQCFAEGAD